MKISIVIPMYNSEKTIEKLLDSIIIQTNSNYEVLLINDGSNDKTELLCEKYIETDKRFLYFYKENNGVSAARNYGLERISGDLVAFLDSDDYIDKEYLKILHSYIDNIDKIDLVVCGYYRNSSVYQFESLTVDNVSVISDLLNDRGPKGYLWNKLFYANIIREANICLDESIYFGEDLLFCVNYLINARKVRYIPKALYYYEDNDFGITNKQYSIEKLSFLTSLEKIIKILEFVNLDKNIIKQYKTYHSRVAMSLLKHGKNKMSEEEELFLFTALNKYRLVDIKNISNKIKLFVIRLVKSRTVV